MAPFFTEKSDLNRIKTQELAHVTPQVNFILASLAVYVTNIQTKTVFSVGINLVQSHVAFQTDIVTEIIRIAFRLQQKDLWKISLRLFTVMGTHMTSKSGCEQTDPFSDITNIFWRKRVLANIKVSHMILKVIIFDYIGYIMYKKYQIYKQVKLRFTQRSTLKDVTSQRETTIAVLD